MVEYPVGSICEVLNSDGWPELIGDVITVTGCRELIDSDGGYYGYEVNDCELIKMINGGMAIFAPPHEYLRLIAPPSEDTGLELILGMFPKTKQEEFA